MRSALNIHLDGIADRLVLQTDLHAHRKRVVWLAPYRLLSIVSLNLHFAPDKNEWAHAVL